MMQIYANIIRIDAGSTFSPLGTFGGGFGWDKNIIMVEYNNNN
jgi:hypothetical protein